ncbi:MAG: ArnT family glycosyltransferase [Muribaculaceae bacterium]
MSEIATDKHSGRLISPAALTLLAVSALLLLPWLGETFFNSKGEPREAIVAVSMLQSGEYILPVNYGGDIPYKPPFMAWMISALAWLLNGGVVTEYISRLPSAIAAIAMAWCGYAWVRRSHGDRFALMMSLVMLTSVEVLRAAVACRLDMVLTACMVCSLYLLYDLRERGGRYRCLRYGGVVALLSCAVLTKGPVGALLPCLAFGIYKLLRGDKLLATAGSMAAIAVMALVVPAWWYYAAYQRGGDEFFNLAWEENIGRLTGTMSYSSHEKPLYYNFATIIIGMLPWSAVALCALPSARRLWRQRIEHKLRPTALFALTAFATIFIFYCIPHSKRSVYLLPCYPFMAYGVTTLLRAVRRRRALRVGVMIAALVTIAAPIAVIAAQGRTIGHIETGTLQWWHYLLLAAPVATAATWLARRRHHLGYLIAMMCTLELSYLSVVQPMVLNSQSDKALIPAIEAAAPSGAIYSTPECETLRYYTINYYLGDRMRLLPDVESAKSLPAGTVVLIAPQTTDTTGMGAMFEMELLTKRSGDTRAPIIIAQKT